MNKLRDSSNSVEFNGFKKPGGVPEKGLKMSTVEKNKECDKNREKELNKSNSDELKRKIDKYENIRLEEHNLRTLLIFTEI